MSDRTEIFLFLQHEYLQVAIYIYQCWSVQIGHVIYRLSFCLIGERKNGRKREREKKPGWIYSYWALLKLSIYLAQIIILFLHIPFLTFGRFHTSISIGKKRVHHIHLEYFRDIPIHFIGLDHFLIEHSLYSNTKFAKLGYYSYLFVQIES